MQPLSTGRGSLFQDIRNGTIRVSSTSLSPPGYFNWTNWLTGLTASPHVHRSSCRPPRPPRGAAYGRGRCPGLRCRLGDHRTPFATRCAACRQRAPGTPHADAGARARLAARRAATGSAVQEYGDTKHNATRVMCTSDQARRYTPPASAVLPARSNQQQQTRCHETCLMCTCGLMCICLDINGVGSVPLSCTTDLGPTRHGMATATTHIATPRHHGIHARPCGDRQQRLAPAEWPQPRASSCGAAPPARGRSSAAGQ
jgi:hypothetical protein